MNDILTELLPRKVRLWLYILGGLVTAGIAAWQAADGNWAVFASSVAATLTQWLAARNITPAGPPTDPPTDEDELADQWVSKPEVNPPSSHDYGSNL